MQKKVVSSLFNRFIKSISGKTGTIILISSIIICAVAVSCSVYALFKINSSYSKGYTGAFLYLSEKPEPDNPAQNNSEPTEPIVYDFEPETPLRENMPPIVLIDPGHGYDDPGTDSDFLGEYSEKDITLDIALRLGTLLSDIGCEVLYTRSDDIIPEGAKKSENEFYLLTPYEREDIIKSFEHVDVFISVHCNSYAEDSTKDGFIAYYYHQNSKYTHVLASDIAYAIGGVFSLDPSKDTMPATVPLTWQDAYYVTKCSSVPSVLVECGFVTNPREAADMLTLEWRQKMAQGLADGIINYLEL